MTGLKRFFNCNSGFWDSSRHAANEILILKTARLQAVTLNPEWCILDEDKMIMQDRQDEIAALGHARNRIESGGFKACASALGTLILNDPVQLIKLAR